MYKLWAIISETYRKQVKSGSFLALCIAPFILIAVFIGFVYFANQSQGSSNGNKIAVVSTQKPLRQAYVKQNPNSVDKKIHSQNSAKKALDNKNIVGYLTLKTTPNKIQAFYHGHRSMGSTLKNKTALFLSSVQKQFNFKQAGVNAGQIKQLNSKPQFKQFISKNNKQNATIREISFNLITFGIYIIIAVYAAISATEIASDKGSKLIEVILSSVSAGKYFVGKILAILAMIITQILIYIVGGGIIFFLIRNINKVHGYLASHGTVVKEVISNLLGVNLVYMLLGVMIYTLLSAFCGALVSRIEEASQASIPATYLCIFAFFVAIFFEIGNDVSNLIVKVLSYIPFFSSFFMPLRIIGHSVSGFEVGISLVILVATIILFALYIGRIYGGLMLQNDTSSFFKRFKKGITYSR